MIRNDLIAPVALLLERQASQYPGKVAYEDASRAVTYAELNEQTLNLASRMLAKGMSKGDRVAIWLPASVDWVVGCLAVVRAGGVAVPIAFDSVQAEVAYRLADAGCDIVLTRAEKAGALTEIANERPVPRVRIDTDEPGSEGFAAMCRTPAPGVTVGVDDIDQASYIIYTSGTTGKAKGVLLTTRGMLWVNAACWSPILGMGPDDRVLSPLPLFHSYALNISVLSILATGASEYIMERFSASQTLQMLQSGRFTLMPGVPTMFHYLMLAAKEAGVSRLGPLRRCVSAGAIMPAALNEAFEEHFGVELLDGYGITETSTMVTMNWPGQARIRGSCGLPLPGLTVRIVDPATGEDINNGTEGELICKGPNLMLGYHDKPDETAKAIRKGWYHTGDLARADRHGFLTITGRLKEIIIRGGQNIAPAEIEECILAHSSVKDCAVVGVPHATLGEVPVVFIVPHAELEPELIFEHCRATLSGYKVPYQVRQVDEIPRTGSGKIIRFRLAEIFTAETAQG